MTEYGSAGLKWLYGPLLPATNALFARAWFSRLLAWPSTWKRSAASIAPFAAKWGIDLEEYEPGWTTFDEFFTRSFRSGARPVDPDPDTLVAPADSRMSVYDLGVGTFTAKGFEYTASSIVGRDCAAPAAAVFRLRVDDCHRYCFPADGEVLETYEIPGRLHTVGPYSAGIVPVLAENYRMVTVFETARFGTLHIVEVGAMLVGRITNHPVRWARRGQEKGFFGDGGSTIVILGDFTAKPAATEQRVLLGTAFGRAR